MKVYILSICVNDQAKAHDFYTRVMGFAVKHDIPMGPHRWLTVTEKGNPQGTEVSLEPSEHPAVKAYKEALVRDGIPVTSFMVDDLDAEFSRLRDLGVVFTQAPMDAGTVKMAVLNDTCGNLIQLVEMKTAA